MAVVLLPDGLEAQKDKPGVSCSATMAAKRSESVLARRVASLNSGIKSPNRELGTYIPTPWVLPAGLDLP